MWAWLRPEAIGQWGTTEAACRMAEAVLPIFEAEYPDDKRPREAINAARAYINDPSEESLTLAAMAMAMAEASWLAAIRAAGRAVSSKANDAVWVAAEWARAAGDTTKNQIAILEAVIAEAETRT
jgi:hypothetical protein